MSEADYLTRFTLVPRSVLREVIDACVNLSLREVDKMFEVCGAEAEWWIEPAQSSTSQRRNRAAGWLEGVRRFAPEREAEIVSKVVQLLIHDNFIPEKLRPIILADLTRVGASTTSEIKQETAQKREHGTALPTVFIVHGHDSQAKYDLKNYLQNRLGLPEPIVLHEKPNSGRTIIEKFEDYAGQADYAAVLLTPDDEYANQGTDDALWRARQNVILELGYFLGRFGRKSGKTLVFFKGKLDIPSDISGLVYIDISNGVESAGEQIRRELCL